MGKNFPLPRPDLLDVDGDNDALIPDLGRCFADQIGIVYRRCVDAHLVSSRIEQAAHIGDRAHAAANGQRNENLRGTDLDDMQDDIALIG